MELQKKKDKVIEWALTTKTEEAMTKTLQSEQKVDNMALGLKFMFDEILTPEQKERFKILMSGSSLPSEAKKQLIDVTRKEDNGEEQQ